MPFKHVVVTRFGGPEVLELKEEPNLPEPAAGQVRIKVLAAGTGFTDTIIRKGQYPEVKEKPPFTIGYDWVGTVDKLGDGVSGWNPGDMAANLSVIGGYTQYLCEDVERIVAIPGGLDAAEAVCMILSYGTAYQMLTRLKKLEPGQSCLVHAAGGAVGTALLELGREMGLIMYGTASKAKHEVLRRYGGIPIDYRNDDFVDVVLEETGGRGVDIVFDTIGAANWSRSYRCVKRGGLLVGFGALQVTTGQETVPALLLGFLKLLGIWKLIPDGRHTCFYNIQSRRKKKPEEFNEDIAVLMSWLKDGRLKPAIDARRPLADARAVHSDIDKAKIAGKIVLMCQE